MSSRNQAIVPAGGHIQEECGVFGLINRFGGAGPRDPAFDAYHAMYALQHRGQDSWRIAACIDGRLVLHKNQGLVPEVFTPEQLNRALRCLRRHRPRPPRHQRQRCESGQRPAHRGPPRLRFHGPVLQRQAGQQPALRREMENRGGIFQTTNDAEVITYLVVREHLRTNTPGRRHPQRYGLHDRRLLPGGHE